MKKKSPGYIDIPVSVIKSCKYLIAGFLTRVFNKCQHCGNYPDILKVAKFTNKCEELEATLVNKASTECLHELVAKIQPLEGVTLRRLSPMR